MQSTKLATRLATKRGVEILFPWSRGDLTPAAADRRLTEPAGSQELAPPEEKEKRRSEGLGGRSSCDAA